MRLSEKELRGENKKAKKDVTEVMVHKSYELGMVAGINFEEILTEAVTLFAQQALITRDSETVTLKDLQLAKGKADNFLSSISNMLEISHSVDLLSAEKYKFRRADELKLLNNLREQFNEAAEFSRESMKFCKDGLTRIQNKMQQEGYAITADDMAEFNMYQGHMANSIATLNTIAKGAGQLIKHERETGGRSSGTVKMNSTNVNAFLENLVTPEEGGDGGKHKKKPRKLTEEEVLATMAGKANG
jgi:hypothetical protein